MTTKKKTTKKAPEKDAEGKLVLVAMNRLVCDTCGKHKLRGENFRQKNGAGKGYVSTCMLCEVEQEKKDIAARNIVRKKEREQEKKKLAAKLKEDAKDRERVAAKERRRIKREDISKNSSEREFIRRTLVRNNLIHFIQRFVPNYQAGWLHHDVCKRLEKFLQDVVEGKNPRLMLFTPPRHGKSEIASKKFPAWALGKHPWLEIIAASYAVSLPHGFSRSVRATLRDTQYQNIFPSTHLDPDNQNVEGWMTTKGGIYIPAGVGGGITGKGANILIIDDPIKDAEEADSETVRESTWDWYGSTAYTRLAPLSGVLVIQTRWHDDDLAGRLIHQMKESLQEMNEIAETMRIDGSSEEEIENNMVNLKKEVDYWEIVNYPAVATADEFRNVDGSVTATPHDEKSKFLRHKNDPLHADRFPYARLMKIKRAVQPRHWSALYQQNPIPEEGLYFRKEMLRYEAGRFDRRNLPIFMAWDLAIGKNEVNDYTVGIVGCIDYEDRVHILDMVRGHWDSFEIVEAILDLFNQYNSTQNTPVVGIEKGQLEKAIGPQLKKRMRERKLYPVYDDTLKPLTDKLVRARPLQGRMQQGMVYFPPNQPWVETAVHELLRFPGGTHDDIVDALAWMLRMTMHHTAPRRPQKKKTKSWKDKLNKYYRDQTGKRDPMGA